jgi:cytochrome c553
MNRHAAEAPRSLATLSLVLATVLVCSPGKTLAQVTVALPTDGDIKATLALPGDIQRGKDAYAECQTCHRTDASGRSAFNIPRLSGQHASVVIKQLMDIRSGLRVNEDMREYMHDSDLTLQDVADMAAYLQSLPVAGRIGQGPPELVPRGQTLYASDCTGCPGERGERGNSNPAMPPILKNYSTEDKQAIAAYLAQLPAPGRAVTPDSPR